jgi:mxaJ protein
MCVVVSPAPLCSVALAAAADPQGGHVGTLRVCLDPDNLPYSNEDGRGFDLLISRALADELGQPLEVHWQPLRRSAVRKTLGEHLCDVLMDVPQGMPRVLTTAPYYRSTFVFVQRTGDAHPVASLDDPRLPELQLGVQLIGNDLSASPAGHALVRRGAVRHVTGFLVDGDEGPVGERMVQAVANADIAAAIAWGPQVGWFARRSAVPLSISPAIPPKGLSMPFEFAISLAVRPGETAFRDRLQAALAARRMEVDDALAAYDVPRTDTRIAGVRR